jgi:hypothetical protein
MNVRETAWRVSAIELNTSTAEIKAEEEKAPSYLVSRLGAKMNRVLIAGVLTEKENVGSPDEPMWKSRIEDGLGGNYYVNVGRYQPEASAAMADLEAPCFVAAVGRVRTYTTDDGRIFVSVRPEHIVEIDESVRAEWMLETAKSTWRRLKNTKIALSMADASMDDLMAKGMSAAEADGLLYALDSYDSMPDSAMYLKVIQSACRLLLPDRNIDFGFPEGVADGPDEIDIEGGSSSQSSGNQAEMEDLILRLIGELDVDGKGAPRDVLERRAEDEGIGSVDLEEITNSLMDNGLIYEPNLRYLKLI